MPLTQPVAAFPPAARASVAAALGRGGVTGPVDREELRALLRGVADAQTLIGTDASGSRLASSNGLDDAAVRGAAAILGPGRPILLPGIEPTLRLIYLAQPVAAGPEGRRVDALLLILAASPAAHDRLLAEITDLLDDSSFRPLLAERARYDRLARHLDAATASAGAT